MRKRKQVFVFGSNKAGRHGKGSALEAMKNHGAIYGLGFGAQGNSWAIPTKGYNFEILPLEEINKYVQGFLNFAKSQQHIDFNVVAIGCGLAGYSPSDIAPMFANATKNVHLPIEFEAVLGGYDAGTA